MVDEPIAPGSSQLDVLMHRDALDHGKTEPGVFDLCHQRAEARPAPGVADRHIVQRAHDALDAGDLSNVGERDRVGRAEPAEARDHVWSSSSTS